MLEFDDLLAARIISKQVPTLRGDLLVYLADIRDETRTNRRSLLATLTASGVLTGDQLAEIRRLMARYKRGRALGIFVHLLGQHGIARDQIETQARGFGEEVTVVQLGKALVEKGLIDPQLNPQVQFQARVIFDEDLQRQLNEHLVATPIRPPSEGEITLVESSRFNIMAQLPHVSSAVFKLDMPVPTPNEDEASAIVGSSSSSFEDCLKPPTFAIPDWVDTSVAGGMLMVADYRILGRIGQGASATIYLGHSLQDHTRPVAIKVLHRAATPDQIGRFKREALATSLFDHPKILDLYEAGEEQGQHFLAMEFFDGLDVEKLLKERMRVPVRDALALTRQLLLGLGAAHAAGVIHRDVKPANVLVTRGLEQLRLTDFGIARVEKVGGLEDRVFHTQGSSLIGTPRYMSPEQAAGDVLDGRSDLYSVGLLLYEMLSGGFPFSADGPLGYLTCHIKDDPAALPDDVGAPPSLHAFLAKLLAKEAETRPATAAAAIEALDGVLTDLS